MDRGKEQTDPTRAEEGTQVGPELGAERCGLLHCPAQHRAPKLFASWEVLPTHPLHLGPRSPPGNGVLSPGGHTTTDHPKAPTLTLPLPKVPQLGLGDKQVTDGAGAHAEDRAGPGTGQG